ncbi:Fanconi anemia group F protein [Lepisosteus oculatus]|uniref:Fanconi anemia group F protein n=1 Tax=Lepisosteus oculatus TaxID=7918 RepID=UPI0035F505D6
MQNRPRCEADACSCSLRMEAICQNLEGTAQLLAVAQSGYVSQWDARAVERALQWAGYCEQLHARFHANADIRAVLEGCLEAAHGNLREALGVDRQLSFADLAQCRGLLLVSLLANPAVSKAAARAVLAQLAPLRAAGEDRGSERPPFRHFCRLAARKGASAVLSHAAGLIGGAASCLDPEAERKGRVLSARLEALLALPDSQAGRGKLLDALLQSAGLGGGGGRCSPAQLRALAAALLLDGRGPGAGRAPDFLLRRLLQNRAALRNLCRGLPGPAAARLARRHPQFREAYLGVLEDWGRALEQGASPGRWTQASPAAGVPWEVLLDRFRNLVRGPPELKEAAESTLNSLKSADGGFEVQGVSVWTDLLVSLGKP